MLREMPAEAFDPLALPPGETVPVLFTAEWCGFCRRFAPHFVERATSENGLFLVVDLSDEESPLWDLYGISVVPTVILFRDGRTVRKEGGVLGRRDLERMLAEA